MVALTCLPENGPRNLECFWASSCQSRMRRCFVPHLDWTVDKLSESIRYQAHIDPAQKLRRRGTGLLKPSVSNPQPSRKSANVVDVVSGSSELPSSGNYPTQNPIILRLLSFSPECSALVFLACAISRSSNSCVTRHFAGSASVLPAWIAFAQIFNMSPPLSPFDSSARTA